MAASLGCLSGQSSGRGRLAKAKAVCLGSNVNREEGRNFVGCRERKKKKNSRVLEQPGRDLSSLEVSVGFDIYHRYTSVVSQMPHPPEEGRQGSGSSWQRSFTGSWGILKVPTSHPCVSPTTVQTELSQGCHLGHSQ